MHVIRVMSLITFLLSSTCAMSDKSPVQHRGTLKHLRTKIDSGSEVHVAFLGGSITQNSKGHTAMVPEWFRQEFPKARFKFTNAGMSSTCSTSGAFRLKDHIWSQGAPDLLIVEFAVNDDQDAAHARRECIRGMEGIVRQTLSLNPNAGIVMVHFVNPGMLEMTLKGKTPTSISAHESVANHYQITSVNVALEVAQATQQGRYGWKEYGGTHPKKFGYRAASDLIIKAIQAGLASDNATTTKLPPLVDPRSYHSAGFVSVKNATTGKGWKRGRATRELIPHGSIRRDYLPYPLLRGEGPNESAKLEFTGRTVGAFILAGPDAGVVESRIDHGKWVEQDLFHRFSEKLNYPRSVIFHSNLTPGVHTLELRVLDSNRENSKGSAINILHFEVNQ